LVSLVPYFPPLYLPGIFIQPDPRTSSGGKASQPQDYGRTFLGTSRITASCSSPNFDPFAWIPAGTPPFAVTDIFSLPSSPFWWLFLQMRSVPPRCGRPNASVSSGLGQCEVHTTSPVLATVFFFTHQVPRSFFDRPVFFARIPSCVFLNPFYTLTPSPVSSNSTFPPSLSTSRLPRPSGHTLKARCK